MSYKEEYFEKLIKVQNNAFREPSQVICGNYNDSGIVKESLDYSLHGAFKSLIEKLRITLLVTREYEHLVIAVNVKKGKLRQSFLHLPHPNGIAVNHKTSKVYVASTRSPNKIIELAAVSKLMPRAGYKAVVKNDFFLTPSRVKYYGGACYFHDLALIKGKLYANSVGKNGIMEINFNSSKTEKIVWSPLASKLQNANYLQLNSIAAGKTIRDSFFSASAEKPGDYKPGDVNFPVDKKGVIFSGKTKKVIARNLTRPHSAKLHQGKLWVNNSGYGELGYIEEGRLHTVMKFDGWTRGLAFFNNIAFVGVSKIIPKFKIYAPGLKTDAQHCAIYAVDMKKKKIIGGMEWPYGNQIYGIEWISEKSSTGFLFTEVQTSNEYENEFFFRHEML